MKNEASSKNDDPAGAYSLVVIELKKYLTVDAVWHRTAFQPSALLYINVMVSDYFNHLLNKGTIKPNPLFWSVFPQVILSAIGNKATIALIFNIYIVFKLLIKCHPADFVSTKH